MKKWLLTAAVLLPVLGSAPVLADADADQMANNVCASCHGPEGISVNPAWPNIAGQKAEYTAKQLTAYRDGTRSDPNMNAYTQTLTDEQIAGLAEYYSKL